MAAALCLDSVMAAENVDIGKLQVLEQRIVLVYTSYRFGNALVVDTYKNIRRNMQP